MGIKIKIFYVFNLSEDAYRKGLLKEGRGVFNKVLQGPTISLIFVIMYLTNLYYEEPRWDSNLGPKPLSLLEFETWHLRPLRQHGRF